MKKLIAILILVTMIQGLTSCYINKSLTNQAEFQKYASDTTDNRKVSKHIKVVYFETNEGVKILFNHNYPGRIIDSTVVGMPQVLILYSEIDSVNFNVNSLEYIWKSGDKYRYISEDYLGFICCTDTTLTTSLKDIHLIKIKKFTPAIAGTVAIVAGVSLISVGMVQFTKGIDDAFSNGW